MKVWGTAIALFLVTAFIVWKVIPPPLPEVVRIATGPADGHYRLFAVGLRDELAKQKITLEFVETSGSVDNIQRLLKREVDLALVQSGNMKPGEKKSLFSVCSLFYEPFWVFYRNELDRTKTGDPEPIGKRIAVGVPGSGAHQLLTTLLRDLGVRDGVDGTRFVEIGGLAARQALIKGEVDFAGFVAAAEVPWLRSLFTEEDVRVLQITRAAAITRHYSYLKRVTIPEGLLDLRGIQPREDLQLVATTASLAMHPDTHDGLISLLIESCRHVVGDGTLTSDPGEFPSPYGADAPIHEDAERYFRDGPSFLHRWLPFRVAHLLTRVLLLALPLLTLFYPLLKTAGPLYRWIVMRRVFRWYRVLRSLEMRLDKAQTPEARSAVAADLARIGEEIRHTHVPARFAKDLFHLRQHHQMLIERVGD